MTDSFFEGALCLCRRSVELDDRNEAAFTNFDCRLSESISDGVNRLLAGEDSRLDSCEPVEAMSDLLLPEGFERFAMLFF